MRSRVNQTCQVTAHAVLRWQRKGCLTYNKHETWAYEVGCKGGSMTRLWSEASKPQAQEYDEEALLKDATISPCNV